MKHSILLVFAHPDDESFGVAGTVAKYSRLGIPVDLACATKGEKGTRVDVPDNIDTGTARESELRAAAAIMGLRDIYFLGYMDGELNKESTSNVASKLAAIMYRLQPEVIVTFGPDGITGHPDHVAIGKAATKAFEAVSRRQAVPRKLYYTTIPRSIIPDTEEWGITTRPDDEVTTTIDISEYFDIKVKAIACHQSQQDARDFIETLKESKDSGFGESEHFFLAFPRTTEKETDFFSRDD